MGERGLQIRSGLSKQGWENADFPILCENCMGESPYIRMMKSHFNRECKVNNIYIYIYIDLQSTIHSIQMAPRTRCPI